MLKNNNDSSRVFGLDILRAAAITLVVLTHGAYLIADTRFSGFPYIKSIDGVDMFFVLSGFLIGSILLKEINAETQFGLKALTNFWKRRWLRTLPNYYLILLANYLVIHFKVIHEDISQFSWKFLFFLQNFSHPFYGFFWESWSLTIEEWFYISAPLLLILFYRFFSPKKSFLFVTILMIIAPLLYRISIVNPAIDDFGYDVGFRKIVLTRLDSIAYGLLAAWINYYYEQLWNKHKFIYFFIGIALIAFIVNYKVPNTTFYKQVLTFTFTPISVMLLLPLLKSIKSAKGYIAATITHISKISYSMYLINLALVAEVIRDNYYPTTEVDAVIKYLLYWTIVIVASTLIYTFYEKPIMNFRDK